MTFRACHGVCDKGAQCPPRSRNHTEPFLGGHGQRRGVDYEVERGRDDGEEERHQGFCVPMRIPRRFGCIGWGRARVKLSHRRQNNHLGDEAEGRENRGTQPWHVLWRVGEVHDGQHQRHSIEKPAEGLHEDKHRAASERLPEAEVRAPHALSSKMGERSRDVHTDDGDRRLRSPCPLLNKRWLHKLEAKAEERHDTESEGDTTLAVP
mmetsp:Transcript_37242/g.80671  ORF Transcript_37242/g.80671 Transcript_37242/m.80671 type:complete len:208 (-) Transcript_37242:38-661(-)